GTLTVGAPADIVLLDARAACNTPLFHPDSNAVYACNGGAVMTVLCQGRVLMHEREVPGEEEIVREAGETARSLVARAEEAQ
ncbi:MAG: amidohydrolase, partial [Methanoculleus chikugoensis]|nr:amidohydrolase [Methanoculleus chikugoensis]